MIDYPTRQLILNLHHSQVPIREISRILKISRNTIRRTLRNQHAKAQTQPSQPIISQLPELYLRCQANAVRIQEVLKNEYDFEIPYSTLTRILREENLRTAKVRSGTYVYEPGGEMQHDTSPHRVCIHAKKRTAQCSAIVLAHSRYLFIQYYPRFTRFEAKAFLTEAFEFLQGVCARCIIDNTSVFVASGAGPNAQIAPEMHAFGRLYGLEFVPHAIGHANRKAIVERAFSYIENNFLAGRTFGSWQDLNTQARQWLECVANLKHKRSIGMSAKQAYVMEKPTLKPLPVHLPPVYQSYQRTVDPYGYVHLDENYYSVPEKRVGKSVQVHKYPNRVQIFWSNQLIAEHERIIGTRTSTSTIKGHHAKSQRKSIDRAPCLAEASLIGKHPVLDQYVAEMKKCGAGQGMHPLRRLLTLKQTYPQDPFIKGVEQALHYGLFDLQRLEKIILQFVAGDFFELDL